jgi:hypothetical protein
MPHESSNPYAPLDPAEPQSFAPSFGLHRFLLIGAVAAIFEGCLSAASGAVMWHEGEAKGFTLSTALDLASILPGTAVLSCYLALARELDHLSLRKSAVGFFACDWLLSLLTLADPAILTRGGMIVVEVCFVASVVGVIVVMFRDASGRSVRGMLAGAGVLFFVFLKFGLKFLIVFARRMGAGALDLATIVQIEMAITLVAAVSYGIWLAVVKLKLRDKLGAWSAWSGGVELASLLLGLIAVAVILFEFIAGLNQPNANEAAVEELAQARAHSVLLLAVVYSLMSSSLTALLFLSIRGRAIDDWRADFAPAAAD